MFDQKQRRTGVRTMRQNAVEQCRLIAKFTPTILLVYNDPALMAALTLVNTACQAFVEEADRVLPPGR